MESWRHDRWSGPRVLRRAGYGSTLKRDLFRFGAHSCVAAEALFHAADCAVRVSVGRNIWWDFHHCIC
eukprot:scaffold952_cov249-Pinguiococcus_pyrenoidosus.AAC.36